MKGRSRFRFRYRGIMSALVSAIQSLGEKFDQILADEETAGNANVFYDPQDLTSLRVGRDGSGGQPVVGDPVGMMLDTSPTGSQTMAEFIESQPELVTNGTFDTDASGWTGINATLSSSSGELVVTSTVAGTCWAQQDIAVTSGSSYLVSVDHKISGISQDLFLGSSTGVADLHNGPTQGSDTTEVVLVTATSSVLSITLRVFSSSIGQTGGLDNVTVKEIPGHHAIAPSDAARPILYDEFDTSLASLTDDGTRGEDISSQGSLSLDPSWTDNGDGSFTTALTSGYTFLVGSLPVEIGYKYEITFEVYDYSSGNLKVRFPKSAFDLGVTASANGSYTVISNLIDSGNAFYLLSNNFSGSVRNISVRKVNTAFDERGDELHSDPDFNEDNGHGWLITDSGGPVTFSNGTLTMVSDGSLTSIQDGSLLESGKTYEIEVVVDSVSGSFLVSHGSATTLINSSGTHRFVRVVGGSNFDLKRNAAGTYVISRLSIKEVITPNLLLTSAGDDDSTFDTDTGNWTKGTGWSISGGVATHDGVSGGGNLDASISLPDFQWCRVLVYVPTHAGTASIYFAGGSSVFVGTISAAGWAEFYARPNGSNNIIRIASGSGISIDNVIIQEVPASIPRSYYLDTDGVDDWMQVTPTLNLGEQWWHTGAWQSDTGYRTLFATSDTLTFSSGLNTDNPPANGLRWADATGAFVSISGTSVAIPSVITVEQHDTNSLSAKVNGTFTVDPITPYNDSTSSQGLALFTGINTSSHAPLDGRFYGGAWGQGQVDYDELTTLQDYLGTLVEPDIDPTDVTSYANVYEMLSAQTAAALFDIDDTTSLRVARDGSGGVPVEGDPVGVMMDVSGTGGLTMEAYLDGATELVTNGTFDTDTDWTKGTGWSISGGSASYSGGTGFNLTQNLTGTVGNQHVLSFDVVNLSGGTLRGFLGYDGSSHVFEVSVPGSYSYTLPLIGNSNLIFQSATGATMTATIDNISVKALPGYTAVAASDAARPTLKTYNSPISSREILTTTYSWNITDGGRA